MIDFQNIQSTIKSKIEREVDSSFIEGFVKLLKRSEENKLSIDSSEPKLQFDNSHISENISDFYSKYSPLSQGDFDSNIKIFISKSLCLFKGLKFISESSETNQAKQEIFNYLNNVLKELTSRNIFTYEIFYPYLYFLSSLDILDNEITGINSFKNKFNIQENLIKCLKANSFQNNNNDTEWIVNFMVNPLNLIHYLEFVLISSDEFLRFQGILTSSFVFMKNNSKLNSNKNLTNINHNNANSPKLSDILILIEKCIKLIFFYFQMSMNIYPRYNLNIFDLVLCNILKSFISFSLEIIINNQDKIDASIVSVFLNDYAYLSLELIT